MASFCTNYYNQMHYQLLTNINGGKTNQVTMYIKINSYKRQSSENIKSYWQANSIREQAVTVISLLFGVKALPVGGRACTHL